MQSKLGALDELLKQPRFLALHKLAHQKQAQVYVVGGAIRDVLLEITPHDIDFVVRGMAPDRLASYLEKYGSVKKVGARFGVYYFAPKEGHGYEIALPRTEKPSGRGGYRDVEVDSDPALPIESDLERRDFTINAMAYDIQEQRLIDKHHGVEDVESKLLRAVGDPGDRLREDLTRMLRAVRLAIQLDFLMCVELSEAITALAPKLKKSIEGKRLVPDELIGKEVLLAFDADPVRTINLLEDLMLLAQVLPEVEALRGIEQYAVFHPEGDVLIHTKRMLENLPDGSSTNLKLSVLFHDIGKARAVQTKDKRGGKRTPIKDPKSFFESGQYDPLTQRIQNIGHDILGSHIVEDVLRRLVATQFTHDKRLQINVDEIIYNVRHHLLMGIAETKPHKAEKILFRADGTLRGDLVRLTGLDPMAGDKSRYNGAVARAKQITGAPNPFAPEVRAKKALVSGDQLKKIGVQEGPVIRKALDAVRDRQLTGKLTSSKDALAFVAQHYVA